MRHFLSLSSVWIGQNLDDFVCMWLIECLCMLILCYRQYTLYYMIYISSIFDPFANIKFLKNIISYLLFISSLMFIMYGWWKVNNLGKYWNRCEQSVLNHNQSPLPSNWYLKEFVACTCNYWPFQVVFFILMLCHESQNFIEHDPIFTNLSMLDKGRTLNRSVWQYLVKSIVLPGQKMSIFFHLCYIAGWSDPPQMCSDQP